MTYRTTEWYTAALGNRWKITLTAPVISGKPVVGMNDNNGLTVGVIAVLSSTNSRILTVASVSGLPLEGSISITYEIAASLSLPHRESGRRVPVAQSA